MDEKIRELLALLEAHPTGRIIVDVKDGRIMYLTYERRAKVPPPQALKYGT